MLGIMPYISTQIIFQLLMLVVPSLKKLSEDASGRKKVQQYTRYATILITLIQSYVVTVYANSIPDVMTMGNCFRLPSLRCCRSRQVRCSSSGSVIRSLPEESVTE